MRARRPSSSPRKARRPDGETYKLDITRGVGTKNYPVGSRVQYTKGILKGIEVTVQGLGPRGGVMRRRSLLVKFPNGSESFADPSQIKRVA